MTTAGSFQVRVTGREFNVRARLFGLIAAVSLLTAWPSAAQIPRAASNVHMAALTDPPPNPQVSVSPSNASLAPGAALKFIATVSGTINQTVTWAATGGTIASDGIYTAGSTAGTFKVTATLTGGTIAASASVANTGVATLTSFLSDRAWSSATNGWGPVERDMSNGETGTGDGRPITLNGLAYQKGLGAHSASDVRYALNGSCSSFAAVVGIDAESGGQGRVTFQVWGDGAKRFDSGVVSGASAPRSVFVDVTDVRELALIVTDGGDGPAYDHADWAEARVGCSTAAPVVPPRAGTTIYPGDDIQSRVAAAAEGAAFVLKSGIHRMQSITPKKGQTFTGETGTILSGARLLTSFARSGSAWVASGQTQQGTVSGSSSNGVCRSTSPRCGYPEDLYINDVPLEHVDAVSKGGPGKWFFDYAANQIYLWDDPAGKTVETSITPRAFGGSATGVTLRGIVIEKYASPTQSAAVELGSGSLIEDSELRLNHSYGAKSAPSSTIRRSHVHHNGALGLSGSGAGIVVEDNEIDHNNYAGYDSFWEAGGTKWVFTDGLIVRGNFSHHNDGPGLWTDISNLNTLYENNIVEDNQRAGIMHECSYAALIRSNRVSRNGLGHDYPYWTTGAGIEVVDSSNVEVYGNTLVDNWQGITGTDDGRVDASLQNHGEWRLINLYVHDNAVSQTSALGAGSGRTGVVTSVSGTFTIGNNRYRNNQYALGPYAKYFMWEGADRSETEWRGYGQDATGTFQR